LGEGTTHLTVSPVEFIERLLRSSCHRELWVFVLDPANVAEGSFADLQVIENISPASAFRRPRISAAIRALRA
jgi:hypothetical protein